MIYRTRQHRAFGLAGLLITGLMMFSAGCGDKAASGPKTGTQTNAFKGSKPPPDVQKQIDATMANLAKEGKHGPVQPAPQ